MYYLKNLNLIPYLKEAYLRLNSILFNKSFFSYASDQIKNNMQLISEVAKINNQEIINLGDSNIIKQTPGIRSTKIKNLS